MAKKTALNVYIEGYNNGITFLNSGKKTRLNNPYESLTNEWREYNRGFNNSQTNQTK